jgi:hypothetical protein
MPGASALAHATSIAGPTLLRNRTVALHFNTHSGVSLVRLPARIHKLAC